MTASWYGKKPESARTNQKPHATLRVTKILRFTLPKNIDSCIARLNELKEDLNGVGASNIALYLSSRLGDSEFDNNVDVTFDVSASEVDKLIHKYSKK